MGLLSWLGGKKDSLINTTKKVGNYDEIKKQQETIVELADHSLNPFKKRNFRNESFDDAYERLGLDEEKLAVVYKNHCVAFYLSYIMFFVSVGFLAMMVLEHQYWGIIPAFVCVGICGIKIASASLRVTQIAKRELISFQEWWNTPGVLYPPSFKLPKLTRKMNPSKNVSVVNNKRKVSIIEKDRRD